jgi:hypothetical protein
MNPTRIWLLALALHSIAGPAIASNPREVWDPAARAKGLTVVLHGPGFLASGVVLAVDDHRTSILTSRDARLPSSESLENWVLFRDGEVVAMDYRKVAEVAGFSILSVDLHEHPRTRTHLALLRSALPVRPHASRDELLYVLGHRKEMLWYGPQRLTRVLDVSGDTLTLSVSCDSGELGAGVFTSEWDLVGLVTTAGGACRARTVSALPPASSLLVHSFSNPFARRAYMTPARADNPLYFYVLLHSQGDISGLGMESLGGAILRDLISSTIPGSVVLAPGPLTKLDAEQRLDWLSSSPSTAQALASGRDPGSSYVINVVLAGFDEASRKTVIHHGIRPIVEAHLHFMIQLLWLGDLANIQEKAYDVTLDRFTETSSPAPVTSADLWPLVEGALESELRRFFVTGVPEGPPNAQVLVRTSPSDAKIEIDHGSAKVGSQLFDVLSGIHDLVVTRPGYQSYRHRVLCVDGLRTHITLTEEGSLSTANVTVPDEMQRNDQQIKRRATQLAQAIAPPLAKIESEFVASVEQLRADRLPGGARVYNARQLDRLLANTENKILSVLKEYSDLAPLASWVRREFEQAAREIGPLEPQADSADHYLEQPARPVFSLSSPWQFTPGKAMSVALAPKVRKVIDRGGVARASSAVHTPAQIAKDDKLTMELRFASTTLEPGTTILIYAMYDPPRGAPCVPTRSIGLDRLLVNSSKPIIRGACSYQVCNRSNKLILDCDGRRGGPSAICPLDLMGDVRPVLRCDIFGCKPTQE